MKPARTLHLLVWICLASGLARSNYLHHNIKNLKLNSFPTSNKKTLSFLSSYLKKKSAKTSWEYLGDRPAIDLKYKRVIASSLKEALLTIYMSLMEDHHKIKLIFGKVKHWKQQTMMKLVFVIQRNQVNESYLGVQLKFPIRKYFCQHKDITILRFGKSINCLDILNLLHISSHEFKHGPSLDFINSFESGRHIWKNYPQKTRQYCTKDLNDLVLLQIFEFSSWLSDMGFVSVAQKKLPMKPLVHPLIALENREVQPKQSVSIGSGFSDDIESIK